MAMLESSRLPPHDGASEQGVIGCILLEPSQCLREVQIKLNNAKPFYDLRHGLIFKACEHLGDSLDIITLQQHLKDRGELDQIGGVPYLIELQNAVPSVANLETYVNTVLEKYQLRRVLEFCTDTVSRMGDFDDEASVFLDDFERGFSKLIKKESSGAHSIMSFDDMLAMDTSNDANCVLGYHNGRTSRYLCKGHSAWLIGPSGVGKSSLLFQMGTCFSMGKDFHGIAPAWGKAMRVLIIQAENDAGDMAEMAKGIYGGLELDDAFNDEKQTQQNHARENIKVVSVTGKIGQQFCNWLKGEVESFQADIVLVDPLLSFAGIDVSRQDQVSQFCRIWLDPILRETGVVMIAAHHTGKPPRDIGKGGKPQAQSLTDLAYAGIGSSELVNWARAVMLLQVAGDNTYRLQLAKRGARAGARHPSGEYTKTLWLKHAEGRIFWEQIEPPAESESKGGKAGQPSKVQMIISLGLGIVTDSITEPTSINDISKKIVTFALSKGEHVSVSTAKKIVAALVSNKALKPTEFGLIKA